MIEKIENLKGKFYLEVVENGVIIEKYTDNNLVVNGGRSAVMNLLGAATSGKRLSKISVGTNGTAPSGSDNAITGAFTKNLGTVTYPTISSVRFDFSIGASEANGIGIREFGLVCEDLTLFARKTRELINKNSDIILNGNWIISF